MRTYIERSLKKIKEIGIEKRLVLSVDIYYDDLKERFVVKLHDPYGLNEHFRSNHIRKSLKMALKWLNSK
jgi:hypothetical protein